MRAAYPELCACGVPHCACVHLCLSCVQVTCYHISTMTIQQRSALARSWLADGKATQEGAAQGGLEAGDASSSSDTGIDDEDGSSTSCDGCPPDLLETWLVLDVSACWLAQRRRMCCRVHPQNLASVAVFVAPSASPWRLLDRTTCIGRPRLNLLASGTIVVPSQP